MLVLTRKLGQRIFIGDDIIITVARLKYDQVALGIECPPNITIYREEIYNRIKEESNETYFE